MLGLMLHNNARSLIKKQEFREALDVLLMGEASYPTSQLLINCAIMLTTLLDLYESKGKDSFRNWHYT